MTGVRSVVGLVGLVIVGACLSACSAAPAGPAPSRSDALACVAVDNEVDGADTHLPRAGQQQAGQKMEALAAKATTSALVHGARQLRTDADAADQPAVDRDLRALARTCTGLGAGPKGKIIVP